MVAFGEIWGQGGLILSGLDFLATLVIAAPFWVSLSVAGWMFTRAVNKQRSTKLKSATAAVVLLASVVATYWAYRNNVGSPSAEYPALVDAYELATPQAQVAMSKVLIDARSRRENFSMSLSQRDRFLEAGGYCVHPSQGGCKQLPRGTTPEGEAVEVLGNMPLKHAIAGLAK